MKKTLFAIILSTLFVSCKKESDLLVNATAYVNSDYAIANFAILNSDQSAIVKDENTLAAYFDSHPARTKYSVHQYSEYLKPGDYIIAIQLTDGNVGIKAKSYTYRNVSTKNGSPSTDNIMEFFTTSTGYFHAWVNKN